MRLSDYLRVITFQTDTYVIIVKLHPCAKKVGMSGGLSARDIILTGKSATLRNFSIKIS